LAQVANDEHHATPVQPSECRASPGPSTKASCLAATHRPVGDRKGLAVRALPVELDGRPAECHKARPCKRAAGGAGL
jgi:hypothetical protein